MYWYSIKCTVGAYPENFIADRIWLYYNANLLPPSVRDVGVMLLNTTYTHTHTPSPGGGNPADVISGEKEGREKRKT
jgi:hypothetical protein